MAIAARLLAMSEMTAGGRRACGSAPTSARSTARSRHRAADSRRTSSSILPDVVFGRHNQYVRVDNDILLMVTATRLISGLLGNLGSFN